VQELHSLAQHVSFTSFVLHHCLKYILTEAPLCHFFLICFEQLYLAISHDLHTCMEMEQRARPYACCQIR